MLHIICAEESEAQRLNIQNKNAEVHITGPGLFNVLKTPRIDIKEGDIVLNVGYAGSNIFKPGEIYSVCSCERLTPSLTIKEEKQYLFPYYFLGADCYTADDFIDKTSKQVPLVDMELYYLSLIYPGIRSIKIVSDNLNYTEFKDADFDASWQQVNKAIEKIWNK